MPDEDEMNAEEERYVFFHELGVAIAQWATVEAALLLIVSHFGDTPAATTTLVNGYLSIDNFRAKLVFVDAIAKERLHGKADLLAQWEQLRERTAAMSIKRNILAHSTSANIKGAQPSRRVALIDMRTFGRPDASPQELVATAITIRSVAHIRLQLFELHERLTNFARAMAGQPVRSQEGVESWATRPPPTVGSLEARMRAALGRQQRPSAPAPLNTEVIVTIEVTDPPAPPGQAAPAR